MTFSGGTHPASVLKPTHEPNGTSRPADGACARTTAEGSCGSFAPATPESTMVSPADWIRETASSSRRPTVFGTSTVPGTSGAHVPGVSAVTPVVNAASDSAMEAARAWTIVPAEESDDSAMEAHPADPSVSTAAATRQRIMSRILAGLRGEPVPARAGDRDLSPLGQVSPTVPAAVDTERVGRARSAGSRAVVIRRISCFRCSHEGASPREDQVDHARETIRQLGRLSARAVRAYQPRRRYQAPWPRIPPTTGWLVRPRPQAQDRPLPVACRRPRCERPSDPLTQGATVDSVSDVPVDDSQAQQHRRELWRSQARSSACRQQTPLRRGSDSQRPGRSSKR